MFDNVGRLRKRRTRFCVRKYARGEEKKNREYEAQCTCERTLIGGDHVVHCY